MSGEGPAARPVRIDLPPFTLVGATTRQGLITTPLRNRFGIPIRLNFYSVEDLEKVVRRGAGLLDLAVSADGAREIARRARGTPRHEGRRIDRKSGVEGKGVSGRGEYGGRRLSKKKN